MCASVCLLALLAYNKFLNDCRDTSMDIALKSQNLELLEWDSNNNIIEIAPGKGCLKVPLGYAIQNLCASRDGDNYISTQTHGCNSDCSVCTGATYTLTYSAENFAKANKGECYAFNHSDVAGTMSGIVFNPSSLNDICSSIPSPAGKSSGTTNRHRFGFLTFVVISLLYSL